MAMMERGEIGATIDAAMGMVSFQADLDRASSLALLSRLEKQMQVTMLEPHTKPGALVLSAAHLSWLFSTPCVKCRRGQCAAPNVAQF
jgi:hypothetical protein